jgi:hypothetical protein
MGMQRMLQNFSGLFTEEQLRKNMEKYNLQKMFGVVKEYFKKEYGYAGDSIILSNNYQHTINSYIYNDRENPAFIHIDELFESTVIAFLLSMFKWSKDFGNLEIYSECFKYVLFLMNDVCIFGKMQGTDSNDWYPEIYKFYNSQRIVTGRLWFSVWRMKLPMHIWHIRVDNIPNSIRKRKNTTPT